MRICLLTIFAVLLIGPVCTTGQPGLSLIDVINERIGPRNRIRTSRPAYSIESICPINSNPIAARVLKEYGAVFAAPSAVKVPTHCVFMLAEDVSAFQNTLTIKSTEIAGTTIELQDAALDALQAVIDEAAERRIRITPLDGSIAGRRSYADTQRIWNSRFLPALNYWVRKSKITQNEAEKARKMKTYEQVERVMEWERQGLYFSTNFSRSIFSSVAPPGTSQHLSLLAFDVVQYSDRRVRAIMNEHGWFQTVANDEPHFTYLGVTESELPRRGLISVTKNGYKFWIPNIK